MAVKTMIMSSTAVGEKHYSHGLNSAGSSRIPDPASPPSWDPKPLFGDPATKLGDLLL